MRRKDEIKYVFVVLGPTGNPQIALKTILFERKVLSKEGLITFYAPYNELCTSYRQFYGDAGMWCIGFSLNALNVHKQVWNDGQNHDLLEDNGLKSCQINKDTLDFSALDRKDFFFVAPKVSEWKEIWFNGIKPGTDYKQWWCKGLHKNCCVRCTDQEISDYLDEKKKPFCWKNYKEAKFEDIFPQRNLLYDYGVLSYDYSLLNLTPKELHEGTNKLLDVTGQGLF